MKEQIFESLRQTYSQKYGVGDEIFSAQAEALAATGIVTEENLATVISGQDSLYKGIASKFDSANRKKSDLEKELNELKSKAQTTTTTQTATQTQQAETKPDEMPAWAKAILDEVKSSKTEVENIKREKSLEQKKKEAMEMFSKLNISDNTKGLANKAQSWVFSNVKDEDTAESLYERVKEEYNSLASSIGLSAYKPIPSGGGGENKGAKKAILAEARKNLQVKGQFPKDE